VIYSSNLVLRSNGLHQLLLFFSLGLSGVWRYTRTQSTGSASVTGSEEIKMDCRRAGLCTAEWFPLKSWKLFAGIPIKR
jgi:hypothetical protein